MKNYIIVLFLCLSNIVFAQQYLNIHQGTDTDTYQLNEEDSMYFSEDNSLFYIDILGDVSQYNVGDIDSLTVTVDATENIYITYNGTGVVVDNPYENLGVTITTTGADVVVNSTLEVKDINIICSGTTSDGSLVVYSEKRFNLLLNDLDITNNDGPAINIQANSKATIQLMAGTENTLTDGAVYATEGVVIDQKATLFSEDKLKFVGSGSLLVNGNYKHGIASDDDILIESGNIVIASALKDGIRASDGFEMQGGTLNVTASDDGINGKNGVVKIKNGSITLNCSSDDVTALASDTAIVISGGNINLFVSGAQSKGISCGAEMLLLGGKISGTAAGDMALEALDAGYDVSYCSFIKADSTLIIDGASLDIITTGLSSRGISGDYDVNILSGTVTIVSSGDGATYTNSEGSEDTYHGDCLKVDGTLTINGGEVTLSNSGAGGRGIESELDIEIGDGTSNPILNVTTTGATIATSSTTTTTTTGPGGRPRPGGATASIAGDEAKAIKADNNIVINSGTITISSADDGINAGENLTIHNCIVTILNSVEGLEAKNITINNGTITIAATDDGINATQGSEVMNDDGSQMIVNGGIITVTMSGNDVDAMDSNGDITINGGTVYLTFPSGSGPSEGLDANGSITVAVAAKVYENGVLY